MNIQLSYLLYNIDEVKYSLILSILFQTKHSIKECLFWAFELYKSKYEETIWNIIIQLYYDFYYIKGLSFEKIIDKEYNAWKHTGSFQSIAKILKELHKQPINTVIFENYYTDISFNNLNINDLIEKKTKNIKHIIDCLKTKTSDEIKSIYKKHYRLSNKKDICLFYTNQKHRWIVKLACKIVKQKTKWIKTKLNNGDEIFICSLHEPASRVYNTLKEKRLFSVNSNIGAFPLSRFNEETDVVSIWDSRFKKYTYDDIDKYKSAYLYNWEFYSRNTPFWSNIFKSYSVTFKKKKVVFPNDEILEKFYDAYGFEPDEQSKEIQLKSLKSIPKISIKKCFENYNVKLFNSTVNYSI
jgi:hypothetical protein